MRSTSVVFGAFGVFGLAMLGCNEPVASSSPEVRFGKASTTTVSVTGALPSSAPQDVTLDIQISGSGFVSGSNAQWLLNGIADPRVRTNSTRYVNSGSLVANITIAIDAVPAAYDIEVITPTGKKGIGTESFLVLPMQELPAPLGANAYDVNSSGVIAGRRSGICEGGPLPVIWSADHVMSDLPLPPGFCNASPESIDAAGRIIGSARLTTTNRHVLRWIPTPSGYSVEIALEAPEGVSIDPAGMNSAGHFVGTYLGGGSFAFWWSEATGKVDLLAPPGGRNCVATDVNDLDQIAGYCTFSVSMAVFWESPASVPVVLPRLAGYTAGYSAYTLNNLGDVAGSASTTVKGGKYIRTGVRWIRNGSTWSAENIGTLGGTPNPVPTSMNDTGWIVGNDNASGNVRHAFLWRPGIGLADLGASGAESYAWGMTNPAAGEETLIAGQSERLGHFRAVVWKP